MRCPVMARVTSRCVSNYVPNDLLFLFTAILNGYVGQLATGLLFVPLTKALGIVKC